jgi:hypothetical protein
VVLGTGAVVAAGAGVAAYGLANDDDDDTTTAPAHVSLDDLEPALLTEDEVGAGFSEVPGSGDDDDLGLDEMETSDECREVIESFEGDDDGDAVQVEFDTDDEATLSHSLALIDEDDPSFGDVRDAIGQCRTITWDDGETQGEMRLSTEDVDGPADDAFALEVEIEASSGAVSVTLDGYAVYSVRDGVVSTLGAFGAVDSATFEGEPADRDLVRSLTDTVDEKVREVLED